MIFYRILKLVYFLWYMLISVQSLKRKNYIKSSPKELGFDVCLYFRIWFFSILKKDESEVIQYIFGSENIIHFYLNFTMMLSHLETLDTYCVLITVIFGRDTIKNKYVKVATLVEYCWDTVKADDYNVVWEVWNMYIYKELWNHRGESYSA